MTIIGGVHSYIQLCPTDFPCKCNSMQTPKGEIHALKVHFLGHPVLELSNTQNKSWEYVKMKNCSPIGY